MEVEVCNLENKSNDINYNLCLVCQVCDKRTIVKKPKESSLRKLIEKLRDRSNEKIICQLRTEQLKNDSVHSLSSKNCFYHVKCYSDVMNVNTLKRNAERAEKRIAEVCSKRKFIFVFCQCLIANYLPEIIIIILKSSFSTPHIPNTHAYTYTRGRGTLRFFVRHRTTEYTHMYTHTESGSLIHCQGGGGGGL